jgi:HK97 family phage portal protein
MAVFSLASWTKKLFGWATIDLQRSATTSHSGKVVTAESVLNLSTVFACARLLSQSGASLPGGLFEKDARGDKVPAKDIALNRILSKKPNANMTAFIFWQAVISNILLWGNAYILKTYGPNKKLISIEPLFPSLVTIIENDDGSLTYKYTMNGLVTEYSEDRIAHFKGFSVSGRVGLSVISQGAQTFGNAIATEEASGRLFSNGMRPGSALKLPNMLKEGQREQLRDKIICEFEGVAKTGGTIILEGGMEYQALGIPPADAQMLESRNFSVEEQCRWFGVPPILIGHSNVTAWGSGVEQLFIAFATFTLGPLLENLEQQICESFIPVTERDKVFFDFDLYALMRADSTGRAALYSSGAQNGWMTRAEIRRRENLPFIEGSEELTVQAALVNLQDLGKGDASKTIEDSGKV